VRPPRLLLVVLLVLASVGCVQRVDVEAERAALRRIADEEMLNAVKANDVEQMMFFYTNDASMFPPNAPIATGKDAIRAVWSGFFALPEVKIDWRKSRVEIAQGADIAYAIGAYELTFKDAEGNEISDRGKDVTVWRKQADTSWKLVADIWNSDRAAVAATE